MSNVYINFTLGGVLLKVTAIKIRKKKSGMEGSVSVFCYFRVVHSHFISPDFRKFLRNKSEKKAFYAVHRGKELFKDFTNWLRK